MTLDDYRDAWQEHEPAPEDALDDEEVLAEVQERAEAFDRKIRRRDWLEIAAAALVVIFFGYEAVTSTAWVARIGAAVVVAGSVLVVWRLRSARRDGRDELAGRPVAERIRAEIETVDAQIRLLESVLWWYVGPLAAGCLLFVVGTGDDLRATLISSAVILAVSTLVWWLNRRAVRRGLRPRRRGLAEMLERIETNGE